LNERELNQEEQDEQQWLHLCLGISVDDVEDERVVAQVAAVGEGQQCLSWIWFMGTGTTESMNDPLTHQGKPWYLHVFGIILINFLALWVEWAKAKACAAWWEEEILLDEEI
jgi:hypothetical protein